MADLSAENALAEAWASIDGKLELYKADAAGELDKNAGYYEGYLEDAKAMIVRLRTRGFELRPIPAQEDTDG